MLTRLLSALVTLCRQRADLENDTHVSDSELKGLISEQVGELYEMADETGLRFNETTATITATGASSYTLPTDHLATAYIAPLDTASRLGPALTEWQLQRGPCPLKGQTGSARFFAIIGQTIEFYPNPSSGSYSHVYVPQPTDLSAAADATSVDLICPAGLTFVVEGVAVKAIRKSETDAQPFMVAREEARDRVRTWLTGKVLNVPRRQQPDGDEYDPRMYDPASWRWP